MALVGAMIGAAAGGWINDAYGRMITGGQFLSYLVLLSLRFVMGSDYGSSSIRGLGKSQLGGVIFGTNKMNINECLHKQLFGLPKPHLTYVKRIEPGLPLFLFNYTDRTLLGIFEAASSGQENLDPYAWTCAGSQKTPYPAQESY